MLKLLINFCDSQIVYCHFETLFMLGNNQEPSSSTLQTVKTVKNPLKLAINYCQTLKVYCHFEQFSHTIPRFPTEMHLKQIFFE